MVVNYDTQMLPLDLECSANRNARVTLFGNTQMSGLLRELDKARRRAGLSKAELARQADTQPASVRRLLSGSDHNPQVSTLASLADALGHEIRIVPKSKDALAAATANLARAGSAADDLGRIKGSPFSTVLADPPWRFMNRTGKVAPEHRRLSRYDTMTTAGICALPISEMVSENAHLYLWVPNALIADGLRVMESWGFTYKSNIVWAKRRKDGGPDGRGVGFYFRNVTELILFGVKGKMRTLAPGRRQVNHRTRKGNSRPMSQSHRHPDPWLFARYSRDFLGSRLSSPSSHRHIAELRCQPHSLLARGGMRLKASRRRRSYTGFASLHLEKASRHLLRKSSASSSNWRTWKARLIPSMRSGSIPMSKRGHSPPPPRLTFGTSLSQCVEDFPYLNPPPDITDKTLELE